MGWLGLGRGRRRRAEGGGMECGGWVGGWVEGRGGWRRVVVGRSGVEGGGGGSRERACVNVKYVLSRNMFYLGFVLYLKHFISQILLIEQLVFIEQSVFIETYVLSQHKCFTDKYVLSQNMSYLNVCYSSKCVLLCRFGFNRKIYC